jgi:hypothetical protein
MDGNPRCERSIRAHVRLGVEDYDDGGTVIKMGIEGTTTRSSLFRTDTLAILELSHVDGIDAKFLIVRWPACQPKMLVLVARHACVFISG